MMKSMAPAKTRDSARTSLNDTLEGLWQSVMNGADQAVDAWRSAQGARASTPNSGPQPAAPRAVLPPSLATPWAQQARAHELHARGFGPNAFHNLVAPVEPFTPSENTFATPELGHLARNPGPADAPGGSPEWAPPAFAPSVARVNDPHGAFGTPRAVGGGLYAAPNMPDLSARPRYAPEEGALSAMGGRNARNYRHYSRAWQLRDPSFEEAPLRGPPQRPQIQLVDTPAAAEALTPGTVYRTPDGRMFRR